jgi:hypothetical protein
MFLKGTTNKLPDGKILRICLVLDDLIKKSIAYKKSIEPELEEEIITENEKMMTYLLAKVAINLLLKTIKTYNNN